MGREYLESSPPNTSALLAPASTPYLTPPEPVPTGDPYVDRGTSCGPRDPIHEQIWRHQIDDYCFLAPSQRDRQIQTYKDLIGSAEMAYLTAVTQLRVDELLRKKPNASWIFELVLDVIGLAAIPAISKVFAAFAGRDPGALARWGVDAATAASSLKGASQGRIETIIRQAVLTGKRLVPRPPDARNDEVTAEINYLDLLTKQAELAFQGLKGGTVLAESTDADLVILTNAYRVENGNSVADYKAQIEQLLQRFDDSGVGRLGVQWNDRHSAGRLGEMQKAETKAFWVQLPMGRKLALYRRGHVDGMETGDLDPGLLGVRPHFVTADESERLKQQDLASRPFVFDRFVPDAFVDMAIEMHRSKWGCGPEASVADGAVWAAVAGGTR